MILTRKALLLKSWVKAMKLGEARAERAIINQLLSSGMSIDKVSKALKIPLKDLERLLGR